MNTINPASLEGQRALMAQRQARVRDVMRAKNVPVLLLLDPINILYATGARNMTIFSTRTPARYLLLFAEGPAILYEYFGCEHLAEGLATIDDVRPAHGLCHVSSGGDPTSQAAAMATEVAATIRHEGLSAERMGVDRFPLAAIDSLRAHGLHLVDADPVFAIARKVKLPGELELIRESLRRVAEAAYEMEAGITPGRLEVDIWADFQRPFIAAGGEYIVSRLLQSGPRTFPYFQEAGFRKLKGGDLICFDTDAVGFCGYCTDFSRTYLCGDQPASSAQKNLYAKAKEQLDWNAAIIKPGATYRDIAENAWPIPEEHQASRYYCIGHGLGMSGEFPNIPHIVPGEPYPITGVIEPGMVLCIESYVGSAGMEVGVKLEDQLLVTETGVERLSAAVPFDDRLLTRMM